MVSRPVGVIRIETPPSNSSTLVSIPFHAFDASIQDLLKGQLTGSTNQATADLICKFDPLLPHEHYVVAFKADGFNDPQVTNGLWYEDLTNFVLSDLTMTPGEGYWIENRQSETQSIFLSGEVVLNDTQSVFLVEHMSLFAYPFSGSVALSNTALAANGAHPGPSSNVADRIVEAGNERFFWFTNLAPSGVWFDDKNVLATQKLAIGKAYWYERAVSNTLTWVETRPYAAPFPADGSPPMVTNMVLNSTRDEITLYLKTYGVSGETLDFFYRDAEPEGSFSSDAGWRIAELDVETSGTTSFAWTDDGSGGRGGIDSVFARFYLFGRADIDTDGDGLADGREQFVYGTSPTDADTDGDGFSDALELEAGSDPLRFTGYHLTVDFCGYEDPTVLTNFPVLIKLDTSIAKFDYADFLSPEGHDLRIWNKDKTRELNYEIDTWNTNEASYVWVQVPVLTNNQFHIWATWGIEVWTNQPVYSTNGAVWSNGYVGVWHMHDEELVDATGNGNFGVGVNIVTGMGYVGGGVAFNGDDLSIIDVTQNEKLPIFHHAANFEFTVEAWVKGPAHDSKRYFSMGNPQELSMHYGYLPEGIGNG
ncbi:MAG: hypothetical protein AAF492_12565, partial [Verrucomicrobiota bacterium]